jgi:arylsulfatase A-like enzyme
MAVGFSLPHVPLYAPQKWFDMYPLDSVFVPDYLDTDMDDISAYAKQLTFGGVAPRHKLIRETGQWPQAVRSYLACISFVDMCVGTVTDALEESGMADNTIVVVFSDHGFHLGEKDRWAKRSLWEESARVPMMITAPGFQRGAVSNKPVGLIDLYPTLVDLCSLPTKKGLDGVSLRPLLKDANDPTWLRAAITTHGPNNHTARSQQYRYIRYDDGSEELYDHQDDPHELRNLIAESRSSYAEIIADHVKWFPKTNAPLHPRSGGSDSPIYGEGTREQSKLRRSRR